MQRWPGLSATKGEKGKRIEYRYHKTGGSNFFIQPIGEDSDDHTGTLIYLGNLPKPSLKVHVDGSVAATLYMGLSDLKSLHARLTNYLSHYDLEVPAKLPSGWGQVKGTFQTP